MDIIFYFFIIGIQFIYQGEVLFDCFHGESKYMCEVIAMPVLFGSRAIKAGLVTGKYLT